MPVFVHSIYRPINPHVCMLLCHEFDCLIEDVCCISANVCFLRVCKRLRLRVHACIFITFVRERIHTNMQNYILIQNESIPASM